MTMTKSVPLSEMSKAELTDERERLRGLQRAHAPLNKPSALTSAQEACHSIVLERIKARV